MRTPGYFHQSSAFFHGHTCSDAVTIDIGANNGDDFSVPGAKAGGVVLGFEPVPSTFERFRKYATMKLKNAAHAIDVEARDTPPPKVRAPGLLLVRAAAGDAAGHVMMIEQATPMAFGSSLVTTNVPKKNARQVSVPVVRLDDFVPWALASSASVERRPLFLVKVDAQGYEVAVFRGARGLFEGAGTGVEYVFLKFSPRMLDRWARQSDAAVAARGVGGAATALLEVGDREMRRVPRKGGSPAPPSRNHYCESRRKDLPPPPGTTHCESRPSAVMRRVLREDRPPALDRDCESRPSAATALLEMLRAWGFLCFDALAESGHVPEDRPSDFERFVRAHFTHRSGFNCGNGTRCFSGPNGSGKWGQLVCVNAARHGRRAAIERLLCDLHCIDACGVSAVADKIEAYLDQEIRKVREGFWATWGAGEEVGT